jgi:simple sugar transport system ATP-binding protein
MKKSFEIRSVRKSFGSNEVLKGISFRIEPGEIVSLLGANGAGKSTLIKILSGAYTEFDGEILINEKPVKFNSPLQARFAGIETVHQKINEGTIAGLTVAENLLFDRIALGEISKIASLGKLIREAQPILKELDLDWDDSVLAEDVFNLGIADQQLLLLARALSHNPSLLILDEPTSALSNTEVIRLFKIIQKLRTNGVAILYVSHRLGEIEELADRLVTLRDGVIQSIQNKPFDWDAALHDMLGLSAADAGNHGLDENHGSAVVLSIENLQVFEEGKSLSLNIRSGEVTGIIGLLGAGKTELARTIFGVDKVKSGSLKFHGENFKPKSPIDAIRKGIFMISEDRARDGILENWSIANTTSLPFLKGISSSRILNFGAETFLAKSMIERLRVVAQSQKSTVDSLSGGNQQKVMVGRWLMQESKLLLLDEPFRGVDIGARREIATQIRDLVRFGNAAIIFSSDIDEILESADRVVVMVDGDIKFDNYISKTSRDEIIKRMSEVA